MFTQVREQTEDKDEHIEPTRGGETVGQVEETVEGEFEEIGAAAQSIACEFCNRERGGYGKRKRLNRKGY